MSPTFCGITVAVIVPVTLMHSTGQEMRVEAYANLTRTTILATEGSVIDLAPKRRASPLTGLPSILLLIT